MVLNVLDEIINGTPKYNITPNGDGTNSIELANEVTQSGTPFNKALFDKIENVLSYNAINGEYNETNQNIEYTMQSLDTTSLSNNMRVLVSPANKPIAPLSSWEYVKTRTQIYSNFNRPRMIKMSDGNIMFVGYNTNSNVTGYLYIMKQSGEVVKDTTMIANNYGTPNLLEMSNGNIVIGGSKGGSYYSNVTIYDKQGNVVVPTFSSVYGNLIKFVELSNGNIMAVASNSTTAYCSIFDKQGHTILSSTQLTGNYNNFALLKLSNNNIIIAGDGANISGAKSNFAILNNDGTILSSDQINYMNEIHILEMRNGNILLLGYSSGNNGNIVIIDKNGNIIKPYTSITSRGAYANLVELDNGNIMILGNYNDQLYGLIINQQGETIKSYFRIISSYFYSPRPFKLSNGYIAILGLNSQSSDTSYMTIIDQQGNIVVSSSTIGSFWDQQLLETDDGNLFVSGGLYSGGAGNFEIIGFNESFNNVTLNNVIIDTQIKQNKYYELVYNTSQNKFIAQEVRN